MREMQRTDRGRDPPGVRQVSVFVENGVGVLATLVGVFEDTDVHTLALTVVQGYDCAIVRFVFNDTDMATRLLREADYRFSICELVAVEMPSGGDGLAKIGKALLSAEVDIHYCYGLITSPQRKAAIVIHVDNPSLASTVLEETRFNLIGESDLR